ncbi:MULTISPECIES: TonB family protein [unclassified Acinetobacter]|uniref:energy transducer TonB n=1 Tax=unclassified Acinetobacter TaxID=196816 RepID=UPI002934878E|nr:MULTISPECIES: TonB family protein [unclassified Acinetobacter]WOE31308.1 TonB family protein [Acinetobacter sp. SAAs470]WOE39504.1 TonB family protein [Acinetobacter sp. SAAs474]
MLKKNAFNPPYFHQCWWNDWVFLCALLAAIVLHGTLVFIDFAEVPAEKNTLKEMALAMNISSETPRDADFLAQANQLGSGKFREKHRISTPIIQTLAMEQHSDHHLQQQQNSRLFFNRNDTQARILLTIVNSRSVFKQQQKLLHALQQQFQAKAAMIATIEAQYLQHQHHFSRQQKIKTLDSIQAKQDVSAHYLEQFREKVEFYGNHDYSTQATLQHLAGEVRLLVVLNHYGEIRTIRLIESSGSSILDEAAKNSVRKAAPFGLFDKKMKNINELRIIRTWRFNPVETEINIDP